MAQPRLPGLAGLAEVAALLAILGLLCGLLGRVWWVFDLASHFRLQYAVVLLLASLVFTLARRRRSAALCLVPALAIALAFAASFLPASTRASDGPRFEIISFNVNTANTRHRDVLDYLMREDADIVLLTEVNSAWLSSLQALRALYPHRLAIPREDNFGIAIFSKHPLGGRGLLEFGPHDLPVADVRVDILGESARFIGVHTLPPMNGESSRLRNEQLLHFAALAAESDTPVILAGDFNLTPFSPWFSEILARSGLRNTANGFGFLPTWMRGRPPLMLPLDHALVSPGFAVTERRIDPALGSDHNALSVTLAPAQAAR